MLRNYHFAVIIEYKDIRHLINTTSFSILHERVQMCHVLEDEAIRKWCKELVTYFTNIADILACKNELLDGIRTEIV